jgi:hypothetical protein
MIWMTWRQHRSAAAVGGAVLLAVLSALVVLGVTARSNVDHAGLASCLRQGSDCSAALTQLSRQYHWLPSVAAGLFALPLLASMFWGAPLIAREIETGTYRLVWTQSISRLRWISTKLTLILATTATAILGISVLAVWAFRPLIPVLGNRFRGGWFDVQGIIPGAYMLFAMALGACMGAVWRRTVPAMATTMVGFAAARIPVHILRRDLLSPTATTVTKFIDNKPSGIIPGDWILSQTSAGAATSGPPTNGPPATVFHYIPAERFWTLQAIEASIYLALTAALIAICITVVVRSRPH